MELLDKNRNFGLDVIRAISICLVVYSHFGGALAFECGVAGVEFFFVLSGFLIGQILYKSFADKESLSNTDLIAFWKRRWWRTLPLYYLVIFIAFAATGFAIGANIFYYIFFLQNHFFGISLYPVTWSLVIEEWFYLIIPLLLYVFYRKYPRSQKVIALLLGFIGFVLVFKIAFVWMRNTPFTGIRGSVPLRLDTLCFGVLLAFIKRLRPAIYEKLRNPFVALLGVIMLPFLVYLIYGSSRLNSMADAYPVLRAVWFPFFSIAVMLMIPFTEGSQLINTSLKRIKPLFFIFTLTSVLTYSIYLVHMPAIMFYQTHLSTLPFPVLTEVLFIYLAAFLLYKFYEHPMTNLRDRKKKTHNFHTDTFGS